MRFTRRTFLQLLGGTAGAAVVAKGQITSKVGHAAEDLNRWATPEEVMVPSICQQCPGGCGLLVRTLDGEVAGIGGNPHHPINRGSVCPKAFGGLQLLYDANRLKGPMARAGERGKFRPIGWDEALSIVASRLSDLRAKNLSHTAVILGGQYRGYRDILWRRFAESYGTPNYIRVRCFSPERPALAHQLMQGVTEPLGYDLAEAQFILSFGAGLLESWLGPVHNSRAFARLRRSSERPRGLLVQVDPRRSPTAIKADRWISIVPGTDGILALGIANAMIREGLYDQDFVEQHTFGFEDWVDSSGQQHLGFKNLVLSEYGLLTVSASTGVPVKNILEIARNLGTLKPAIVIGERGPVYGADDLHTRMAIHSLNALVGNIGITGGLRIQGELPLASLPAIQQDSVAKQGTGQPRIDGAGDKQYLLVSDAPQMLPERIASGTPYPVNALFLFATNPLANHPAKEALAGALKKVPFIVSFSPFLDESSSIADLILPDHTYLERWQDDQVTHLAGFTCFSIAPPVAAPLHQTRNSADVVLQISQALGGPMAENFPWKKFEDLLKQGAQGLYESSRGYVVSAPAEEALRKVLERQGYWVPEFKDYEAFWNGLLQRGAWWDPTGLPVGTKALLKTPSGKFEFYSTALKQLVDKSIKQEGKGSSFVSTLGAAKSEDLMFLPTVGIHRPAQTESFPLRLNTYRLMSRPTGGGRDQPWLLEQPAVHLHASWESWVELHPRAAAGLGVKEDDWVWVESQKGRIKLRAKLYSGTRLDVVHIPLFGGDGPNPNDLIANETDTLKGFGLLNTTQVRIRRA
ncbi:MAG TPA: molybdopterin-dependent oxidoreductase [Candidatus Binatia bacterium]|nr:molybdopterin-dependent oxidoreductase [Candidatus Binatia bacterium]